MQEEKITVFSSHPYGVVGIQEEFNEKKQCVFQSKMKFHAELQRFNWEFKWFIAVKTGK